MHILVLNVGSSTIKFQLVATDGDAIAATRDRRLARGQVERIGGEAIVTLAAEGRPSSTQAVSLRDHAAAIEYIVAWLTSVESGVPITRIAEIEAVGHRAVHGGERFSHSTRLDDALAHGLDALIELPPLHHPH